MGGPFAAEPGNKRSARQVAAASRRRTSVADPLRALGRMLPTRRLLVAHGSFDYHSLAQSTKRPRLYSSAGSYGKPPNP